MTYDFLSFIDSEAIREHIRKTNYEFTPAEQAVILTHSYEHTVEEKLEALEYLYGKYTEEEFGADKVGMFWDGDAMPFREKLRNYINGVRASMALSEASEGYVFVVQLCEEGWEYPYTDRTYFTSYRKAYEFLSEEKNNNKFIVYEYRITTRPEGKAYGYEHTYDNDLRLVDVTPVLPINDESPMLDISEYYVWIPLPFHKGDLVKARHRCGWCFRDEIGVFAWQDDETDEKFLRMREHHRRQGDYTDMDYRLESFYDEVDNPLGGYFTYDNYAPLELVYCNDDDLRHLEYGTKALAVATDESSGYTMKDLLFDYSRGFIKKRDCPVDLHEYLREKLRRQ